jgi:hypothetical protein
MKESRNLARIEILNYVIAFCTVKCFGQKEDRYSYSLGSSDSSFHGGYGLREYPPIDSLVMLQSAPVTKYYLGWLKEINPSSDSFSTKYLIESIEDGELCWWENVGVWYLPLETSNKYPEWKWTDRQFAFKKRWFDTCYKKGKAFQTKPYLPIFMDDGSVILGTRERWNIPSDYKPTKKFDNWKKVTINDMLEFYKSAVQNKPKYEKEITKLTFFL